MKSFTTLTNLYTSLTQNSTSTNTSLGQQLMSDQHRYLIQKYFDNERSVTTTTVGSSLLTLTGSLSAGATSATLSASWGTLPTGSQLVNFSDGEQRTVLFTTGSTAISWQVGLINNVTSAITTLGFQAYNIPANISKVKNDTVNVGQLRFVPAPVMTRAEWDLLNFLPYNSDIPNMFFIYNGQLLLYPIPSTTGNVITFNYKTRVPDLSFADYGSTPTLSTPATVYISAMTPGSTTVTFSADIFTTTPASISLLPPT